jgi:hypothetical protein
MTSEDSVGEITTLVNFKRPSPCRVLEAGAENEEEAILNALLIASGRCFSYTYFGPLGSPSM